MNEFLKKNKKLQITLTGITIIFMLIALFLTIVLAINMIQQGSFPIGILIFIIILALIFDIGVPLGSLFLIKKANMLGYGLLAAVFFIKMVRSFSIFTTEINSGIAILNIILFIFMIIGLILSLILAFRKDYHERHNHLIPKKNIT